MGMLVAFVGGAPAAQAASRGGNCVITDATGTTCTDTPITCVAGDELVATVDRSRAGTGFVEVTATCGGTTAGCRAEDSPIPILALLFPTSYTCKDDATIRDSGTLGCTVAHTVGAAPWRVTCTVIPCALTPNASGNGASTESTACGPPGPTLRNPVVFEATAAISCFGCGVSQGTADLSFLVGGSGVATYTVSEAPGLCPLTGSANGSVTGDLNFSFQWTRVGATAVIATAGDLNGSGVASFVVTSGNPCGGPVTAKLTGVLAGA